LEEEEEDTMLEGMDEQKRLEMEAICEDVQSRRVRYAGVSLPTCIQLRNG
jgi:hypothetical protein